MYVLTHLSQYEEHTPWDSDSPTSPGALRS